MVGTDVTAGMSATDLSSDTKDVVRSQHARTVQEGGCLVLARLPFSPDV